jgi:hypothetical protein
MNDLKDKINQTCVAITYWIIAIASIVILLKCSDL